MARLQRLICVCAAIALGFAVTIGVPVANRTSADGTPIGACAVTQANDVPQPPMENAPIPGRTFAQNDLWISLGPPDPFTLYASQELGPAAGDQEGMRANKMLWLRGENAIGELSVTARRLDGHSPEATQYPADQPSPYGDKGFAVVSLAFPDPGCWEISATGGSATLTLIAEITFLPDAVSSPVASTSNQH